jgi:uncharacterized membrane protein YgcG
VNTDLKRFDAAARAAALAAALATAALAQGCARRDANAPPGGAADVQTRALTATPSPAQAAPPAQTPAAAAAESPLPRPEGHVNDFAGVIDGETRGLLEARLRRLRERANIEMGVATVETTAGRDINEYSLAVARAWGVGPPEGEPGGGLLLLLAVKDRKWRLQVSERLRGDLPDDAAAELARVMTEPLRAGRYGEAVDKYVDAVVRRLAERRGFPAEDLLAPPSPAEQPAPAKGPKPRRKP